MENVNKKILLVEDDLNFGAVLKDYLMLNDFDVVLAKNGMEGFEKFKKDSYDLCILDVMMPYKDGYTLAKEIREKNQEVPIIFLTAKSMKEDVLKGYKAGADDYLNKPFDSEVLLMKIRAIIQRKSSTNVIIVSTAHQQWLHSAAMKTGEAYSMNLMSKRATIFLNTKLKKSLTLWHH